ncbi:hypothetical protein FRC06_006308 [Ceratobasidium sp. 370]|nr:hypothetical protein FRC06_006308 [Ceratobasidium sp. 370]
MLIAVRGDEKDGMNPVYISSPKARTFLESYLKVDSNHFVTSMECASIGGASAVAVRHRTNTQIIKSNVRVVLLESLCKAATSVGSDGSEPTITNPLIILAISYSDYVTFVDQYKVEAFNWPMNGDKMIDPSNVGGLKTPNSYLKLIESGKAGFRCITVTEWEAWKKARDEAEVVVPAKRPPRKRINPVNPSAEPQPKAKKARQQTSKPRAKAKSNRKRKANDVGTASGGEAEANSSDIPADDTEPASDCCSIENLDAAARSPSPLMIPLPLPTVSNIEHYGAEIVPASPPIDERFRITIDRRPITPHTPLTPSTVTNSVSSSPDFFLRPVPTQPQYHNTLPDFSQGSPSCGRRLYSNSWDRPFINYTPDSISSGQRPSRSTSRASRSNSPAHSTRSQNQPHTSATSSPLTLPTGLLFPPLLTNNALDIGEFFPLPTSHVSALPPFGFEPPSGQFGPGSLGDQDALLASEWNFGGLHPSLPAGLVPEPRSTTPVLSEFAACDA